MTVLLTLTTTHRPATDLGLLLDRPLDETRAFSFAWGSAHVFFPEATDERCTAALLLEVDPIRLAKRSRRRRGGAHPPSTDDRPYVASSLLSAAITQVLANAMRGESREHQALADRAIPLRAHLPVVHCRGGRRLIEQTFLPLGYAVTVERTPLDPRCEAWGESALFSVTLERETRLAELLTHLCALIPVIDDDEDRADEDEARLERPMSLRARRHQAVIGALLDAKATRVLDLGCGDAALIRTLLDDHMFERVIGCDVSPRALERAARNLDLGALPEAKRARLELIHGSALYRDPRFGAVDAICMIELIEHIDPLRLPQLERVVFGSARPRTVILTTPNREHNARIERLPAGELRHADHRFEWTRSELEAWCDAAAKRHGYSVALRGIGDVDPEVGPPTQMAIFTREESAP